MFERKVKGEEMKWKQRSRIQWLKAGDKNTKFFYGMAFARLRGNKISYLIEGSSRLEDRESITKHILEYFLSLYAKEDWDKPSLQNLHFASIREGSARWLEREFQIGEVRHAVFNLGKRQSLMDFPVFFQRF